MNEIIINQTGDVSVTSTAAELCDRWVMYIDASQKTIQTYTRNIRQFANWLHENGITAPTREDVINFREDMKVNHSAATVQAYLTTVKLFFKWTEQEHLYPNIADRIKGVKLTTEHKKDPLTTTQLHNVFSHIDRNTLSGKRDYAILCLGVTTGLRTISIINADIKDIRTIGDNTVLFYQGKGHSGKDDYVKLSAPVEMAIREYLAERKETTSDAALFASTAHRNYGERMTTRSISGIVKTALRNAGYDSERLTAHSIRHTFATQALLNGASIQEVQQAMAHSDINTTMIYAHNIEKANNTSFSRVSDAIFS